MAGSGLGYFDDMMFHFGYHNAAEVKNNRSFIRAYDRLKKKDWCATSAFLSTATRETGKSRTVNLHTRF